jgi:hypothetical protein
MASIDGVVLSAKELSEHHDRLNPIFEFSLDQLIYYMEDSKVHSAPCTARMCVQNLHEDWASNDVQKEAWTPFGPAGVYYSTCHGIIHEDRVFGSKAELLDSL